MTLSPCNNSLDQAFVAQVPEVVRTLLDADRSLGLNASVISLESGTCQYRVTVSHLSGVWFCQETANMLGSANQTATAIKEALVQFSPSWASANVEASQPNVVIVSSPTPEPDSPIPFSPYVIIIPAVIVALLFGVCLWMWCARPKIKRQERPVFDGFEMGDAQQLESSSNLEFAVPEVEFEDPRGGSKHRLTIN